MSGIFAKSDIKTGGVKRSIKCLTEQSYGFCDSETDDNIKICWVVDLDQSKNC